MINRDYKVEQLIAGLLHTPLVFTEVMTRITGDVFAIQEYNNFLADTRKFYNKYKKLPSYHEATLYVNAKSNYTFLSDIFHTKPELDSNYLRDKWFLNYQMHQTLGVFEAYASRIETSTEFSIDDVYTDIKAVTNKTKPLHTDHISLNVSNVVEAYKRARDFRISQTKPLAFKILNILLHGGIAVGELLIFIAPPNRGKTLYLVNELFTGLCCGDRVLYLTMENLQDSVLGRLFDRTLLTPKDTQRLTEHNCTHFLKKFMHRVQAPTILYQPANTFSVADLEAWIEQDFATTGLRYDRIIIDYMQKLKKPKSKDTWDAERRLTDDLRALMLKLSTRGITAAQTSRVGTSIGKDGGPTEIHEDMLQGGFGQFETADIVAGYSESPTDKQRGIGKVTILKARETGGRGRSFAVHTAPWIGLITDEPKRVLKETDQHLLINPDTIHSTIAGIEATPTTTGGAPIATASTTHTKSRKRA